MSAPDPQINELGKAPSEEELRVAYEEQLSRVSSAEMALSASLSLLALGARRLGLVPGSESQRDLDQVRDAVDAVRGILPVLERSLPEELGPLRDALSQLQLAYAREAASAAKASVGGEAGGETGGERGAGGEAGGDSDGGGTPYVGGPEVPGGEGAQEQRPGRGPGPAEESGRLWVPGR